MHNSCHSVYMNSVDSVDYITKTASICCLHAVAVGTRDKVAVAGLDVMCTICAPTRLTHASGWVHATTRRNCYSCDVLYADLSGKPLGSQWEGASVKKGML